MSREKRKNVYLAKGINIKQAVFWFLFYIDVVICVWAILVNLVALIDFNTAAFGCLLFLAIAFGILVYLIGKKLIYIEIAKYYADIFMNTDKPFLNIKNIPSLSYTLYPEEFLIRFASKEFISNPFKMIGGAIKHGYLKNCTIEIHNGVPKVALLKKVVMDSCPNCGAPIIGAINDVYICKYCGSKIDNVIEKK